MPDKEEFGNNKDREIDAFQDLIQSPAWKYLALALQRHKQFLQDKANKLTSQHKDREAGECVARMSEINNTLSLPKERLEELRNTSKGGEQ